MRHEVPIAAVPANKRALILPGGGMRVAYQAGAVKALHDAGLRFSFADGASGGTMNLAALLSGISPDELCARWRRLVVTRFVSPRPLGAYLGFPNVGSLGDFDCITASVFPGLGIDFGKLRDQSLVSATFNVCEFDSKTVLALPSSDINLELLQACISLPLATPAVEVAGKTYTDAVWIRDCNLMAAVKAGSNELWVVWCIGNTPQFHPGLLEQYVHMIEMSALGALHRELDEIAELNAQIASGGSPHGHSAPIVVHLIRPEVPIPLDPDYVTGKVDGNTLVDSGYRDASSYLAGRQAAGVLLDSSSTRMRQAGRGLTFRESMVGRVTLGVTDPKAGYVSEAAIPVVLRASIEIDDVSAFAAEPNHEGRLAGHLYSPRLGGVLPATAGIFKLFAPGESGREMVYDLGIKLDGKPVWFKGRKHVGPAMPWQLWPATTTLYVTLHQGSDPAAPVIGAGILRLDIFGLLGLLGTLHSRGCIGLRQRLAAVLSFFTFFGRQLWRTYAMRRA